MTPDAPPFSRVDRYPDRVDGPSVIARFIDGLGFRLYWATDGLTDRDYAYRACEGAKSIGEILLHVRGLASWMCVKVIGDGAAAGDAPDDPAAQRDEALRLLLKLREHVAGLTDEQLAAVTLGEHPFWRLINGPLADAVSHVGQISYLRRAAGNPNPGKASVLALTAPRPEA